MTVDYSAYTWKNSC